MTGAARAHQPLVWRALRPRHRAAAHRRHGGRVGGTTLSLPGAFRRARRQKVLMPDPSYLCNRHFVTAADGVPVLLPATAGNASSSARPRSRGRGRRARAACCSPRRPTRPGPRSRRTKWPHRSGRAFARGLHAGRRLPALSFDDAFGHSALAHGDDVISINSFSKHFCMTGWRLGWLVLPEALVPAVELAQNLYICPSGLAQQAALACFERRSPSTSAGARVPRPARLSRARAFEGPRPARPGRNRTARSTPGPTARRARRATGT